MLIGHFGVALAAKSLTPKTSLGTLFLSVQLVDFVWPIFLILGIEQIRIEPANTALTSIEYQYFPYTHSLLGVVGWAMLIGMIYYVIRRNRNSAYILALGTISHWVLDALVHRADLPLLPGYEVYVGIGLWNSLLGTVLVELSIFLMGLIIYVSSTVAIWRLGIYGFWGLIAILLVSWIGSITGLPPSSEKMVAIIGLSQWIIIPWAYWIDNHRHFKGGPAPVEQSPYREGM